MLFSLLLAGVVHAAPVEGQTAYHLGAGDTIRIEVFKEPDLSRTVQITATCNIEVGLIGDVSACDRTPTELKAEIEDRLADGYLVEPIVIVDVTEYGSQKVEIGGQIKTPGVQILKGPTTLSQIIAQAGGPAAENVVEVLVVSANNTTTTYQLRELEKLSVTPMVEDGDKIILGQGRFVHVSGEVGKVGPVPYRDGLRVSEAFTQAGGFGQYASHRGYLVRSNGDKIRFNMQRILDGREPDIVLNPDDKLVIKRSAF